MPTRSSASPANDPGVVLQRRLGVHPPTSGATSGPARGSARSPLGPNPENRVWSPGSEPENSWGELLLANDGGTAMSFTVTPNDFGSAVQTQMVGPGEHLGLPWPTDGGRYDVTVTAATPNGGAGIATDVLAQDAKYAVALVVTDLVTEWKMNTARGFVPGAAADRVTQSLRPAATLVGAQPAGPAARRWCGCGRRWMVGPSCPWVPSPACTPELAPNGAGRQAAAGTCPRTVASTAL
ncbi:phospholipase domain-containing protein [Streptomyces sp. NPDC001312]|uniref:phospholipase domain-containing protein n=1 Tax=Streptomyces sp. NPDC001312 TaxID=3364561 RepID=UPI0036D0B30E